MDSSGTLGVVYIITAMMLFAGVIAGPVCFYYGIKNFNKRNSILILMSGIIWTIVSYGFAIHLMGYDPNKPRAPQIIQQ